MTDEDLIKACNTIVWTYWHLPYVDCIAAVVKFLSSQGKDAGWYAASKSKFWPGNQEFGSEIWNAREFREALEK